MATDHTDGAPPSRGSTILVNIGCTANSSAALRKIAAISVGSSKPRCDAVIAVAWFSETALIGGAILLSCRCRMQAHPDHTGITFACQVLSYEAGIPWCRASI